MFLLYQESLYLNYRWELHMDRRTDVRTQIMENMSIISEVIKKPMN